MSDYDLSLSATKVWKNGFIMELNLTNTGSQPLVEPFVDVAGTASIIDLWGGAVTELDNGQYRIHFEDLTLEPGEASVIKFKGEGSPDLYLADTVPEPVDPEPVEPEPTPTLPEPIEPEPEPTRPEPTAPTPTLDGPTVTVATNTSAAELESMIRDADAGTVFQLEAGTYHFDRTIEINRSDIALIGAGSGETRIEVPSHLNQEAFSIGSGSRSGSFELETDLDEGATTLELAGSHSFVAGDFVYLSRESTNAFYDSIGDETWRKTDVPLRTSIVEVTEVNGNSLTLADGVHFDFTTSETTVREIAMVQDVTLGGFEVDYGLGTADPSDFDNTLSGYDRDAVIQIQGTAGLHVFDIMAQDVPSLGLNIALSTHVAADGLTFTGAHNKGGGGNGYAVQIRDVYESNLVNLSDMDMRHSVVFASWRSAVDNQVHVARTDRDINFHGGRDHGNTVRVDESLRDADSDIIAPTLFVNTLGTHYGSVTDADANDVRFGTVIGTRLGDAVQGYDTGAWLDGRGGNDTLTGGAGNDVLIGGEGRDVLIGGAGTDIALYTGQFSDFRITDLGGGQFQLDDRAGSQSRDTVEVEWAVFDDGALRFSDMAFLDLSAVDDIFAGAGVHSPGTPTPPVTETPTPDPVPEVGAPTDTVGPILRGTDGKDTFVVTEANTTVHGGRNWDVVKSSVDFTLSDDVEKLELTGSAAIDATGSGSDDLILGNDGPNVIRGKGGDDRIWGRDDDDVIVGGDGADELNGGDGADTFRFVRISDSSADAPDTLTDFESGTDIIDLSLIDADSSRSGNQEFVWNGDGAAALWQSEGHLYGDTDGDGAADLSIDLNGVLITELDLML